MVGRGAGGGRAYTQYRVWGSIGYIVVALLTGWMLGRGGASRVLERAELAPVFTYGPLIFFAVALFCLLVPDRKNALSVSTPSERKSMAGSALDENALSQNFRRFLIAFFFYQFALYGASAYISLYLKSLGATPLWITGTFATGVVCEVLVMTQVGRWSDLYGRRPALALAFLLMPLRLLLYIPATGPLWVLIVQSLHGFNFGIMGAIAVVFANDLATDRNRSATQARLTGVGGLATATGPMLCGWLAQYLSIGWMFAIMALFGTVGAVIFLTRVRESHPAPRALSERGPLFLHPFLRLLAAPPAERSKTTVS
jgi:PPP family 3-phenylpropionic acid transporter